MNTFQFMYLLLYESLIVMNIFSQVSASFFIVSPFHLQHGLERGYKVLFRKRVSATVHKKKQS